MESIIQYLSALPFIMDSKNLHTSIGNNAINVSTEKNREYYKKKSRLEWDIKEILRYNFDAYAETYEHNPEKLRTLFIENLKKWVWGMMKAAAHTDKDKLLLHTVHGINKMIFKIGMLFWYQTYPEVPFFVSCEFESLLPTHIPLLRELILDTNASISEHLSSKNVIWKFLKDVVTEDMKERERLGKEMILRDTSIKATHKGAKKQMHSRMLIDEVRAREEKAIEKISLFFKTFESPEEIPHITFSHTWNGIPLHIEVMTEQNGFSISYTSFSITKDTVEENIYYYFWDYNPNEILLYIPTNNLKLKPLEYLILQSNTQYTDDDGVTLVNLIGGVEGGTTIAMELMEVIADGIYEMVLPIYMEKMETHTSTAPAPGEEHKENVSEVMEEETQDALWAYMEDYSTPQQESTESVPTKKGKILIPYKKFLFKVHKLPKNKKISATEEAKRIYKEYTGEELPEGQTLRRLYYRKQLTFQEGNAILEKYFGLTPDRQNGSHMASSRVLSDGSVQSAVLLNKTTDATRSLESALEQAHINEDLFYQVVRLHYIKKGNVITADEAKDLMEEYALKVRAQSHS